jgi:hypothetical protein
MSIRVVGLAVVLALSAACPWNLAAQDRSVEHTPGSSTAESVVRRFWDAFSRAAWDELDDLVSRDLAHHPPGQTRRRNASKPPACESVERRPHVRHGNPMHPLV